MTTKKNNNSDDKFISKVCEVLHKAIDKEMNDLKDDMIEEKIEREKNQEEIKKIIEGSYENLKNKIIVTEKGIKNKIDTLDDFDSTLRGNGTPGVWESIRTMNRNIKYIFCVVVFLLILALGGSWNDITTKSIRESIFPKKEEVKIDKKYIIVVPEVKNEIKYTYPSDVKKDEAPKIKTKTGEIK